VTVRIGLEIHVYLKTHSKLFCACSARFLEAPAPNTQVCALCTGQPGAKPMGVNAEALRLGLQVAQALGCTLMPGVRFQRKHYFYPDSPANYQRTATPHGTNGSLEGVRIRELHWEEDPGAYDLREGTVDYNRAGAPLLEIVTEPDLRDPAHARAFLAELRFLLDHLDANYEAAGLKADVNVSVPGGERVEVKNVNGLRNVETAIDHEVARQTEAISRGEPVGRETRHFDEVRGVTTRLRTKEEEADYRYMEDPDLPWLPLPPALLSETLLPEAPLARRTRFETAFGLARAEATTLLRERSLADAFEALASTLPPAAVAEFLQRDLRGELHARGLTFTASGISVAELTALLSGLGARSITPQVATRLLRERLDFGRSLVEGVRAEAAEKGTAEQAVGEAVVAALAENPKAVEDYRAGKATALNFLVGAVMKRLKGRAAPDVVRAAVEAGLGNLR